MMSLCRTMVLIAVGAVLAGCASTAPWWDAHKFKEVEGRSEMNKSLDKVRTAARTEAETEALKAFGIEVQMDKGTQGGLLIEDRISLKAKRELEMEKIYEAPCKDNAYFYCYRIKARPKSERDHAEAPQPSVGAPSESRSRPPKIVATPVTPAKSLKQQCEDHVKAGQRQEAVKCYAGVLKEAPGDEEAWAGLESLQGTKFQDCTECPEMVVVPPGKYKMGSKEIKAKWRSANPVHEVEIARPFAVGVYEVTFDEWDACVEDGGCVEDDDGSPVGEDEDWGRGRRPVINVNWEDAKRYVEWLSGKTGREYRLLSESEWEYVARAGTTGPYHFGSSLSQLQANYYGTSWERTQPVGSYQRNGFLLYDMHGNVWEWVKDCWNRSYEEAPTDGSAWESGDCRHRVIRGGSWTNDPNYLRSAFRMLSSENFRINNTGFRVARTFAP